MPVLVCYTVIKGRPRPLPRAIERVSLSTEERFPPATAGGKVLKCMDLSM